MSSRGNASLNAVRRAGWLDQLGGDDAVDLVVVGGGITGTGVALDAASRGLRTVLLEAHDLAFGTSRWSSKLAHGGLRYLANGQIGVAHESAVERGRLLANAPHLVRGEPTLLPLLPGVSNKAAAKIGVGFALGDVLRRAARTPRSELGRPRRLSAERSLALAPRLAVAGVRGGVVMFDGQLTDDARLVAAVARTAAREGAAILTHCRATALGDRSVDFEDQLTGERGTIKTRATIDASGVWAPQLDPDLRLKPSRGTHVVLSGDALPGLRTNLTLPYPGERNRYLLVLPQLDGRVYLGLTDVPVDTVDDVPQAEAWEIEQMTSALGEALGAPIDPAHVLGAYAGLRPLLAPDEPAVGDADAAASATADLSRHHAVLRSDGGVVHVVGGKLTTYRRMAQDAVDAAIDHVSLAPLSPCRTERLPITGAAPRTQLAALATRVDAQLPPAARDALADPGGRSAGALLVARYGTQAGEVAALAAATDALSQPVAAGGRVLAAELHWSVAHEGALTASDLLDRRFRLGLVDADRAAALGEAERAVAAHA